MRAPSHPHWENVRAPAINRAMWLTEEYAMRDFISGWRIQIRAHIIAPHKEMGVIRKLRELVILGISAETRSNP